MSFFDLLDKVRAKPESYRYRVLFTGLTFFMGLIVILWITFSFFLPESKPVSEKREISPFGVLKDTVLNIYESARGQK